MRSKTLAKGGRNLWGQTLEVAVGCGLRVRRMARGDRRHCYRKNDEGDQQTAENGADYPGRAAGSGEASAAGGSGLDFSCGLVRQVDGDWSQDEAEEVQPDGYDAQHQ